MSEVKPYWTLELQIDADLLKVATDEEAKGFAERLLVDLVELVKRHHEEGADISVSLKLNRQITEYHYQYNEGVT